MNLHVQKNEISQLNAVLERILRSWAVFVGCDLELALSFEPDDQNPSKDRIAGYYMSYSMWHGFGDLVIGDEGRFEERLGPEAGMSTFIVNAAMKVCFPRPVMAFFQKHAATDMFEHEFDHIGVSAVLEFDDPNDYMIFSNLKDALRETKLDAFTETLLRPNAGLLSADLQPYLEWFEYGVTQVDVMSNETRREQLIDDLNLVLLYLSQGGTLNFVKLTSLCDVAGSLQPVRNLIQSKRPELVV
jgi:hypothetical protein